MLVFGGYVGGAVYLQTPVVLLYGGPPRPLCGGVRRTYSDLRPAQRGATPGWEAGLVSTATAGLGQTGVGVVLMVLLRNISSH